MELIIFDDVEEVVGQYLLDGLAAHGRPVPVSTLAPDDKKRTGPAHTPYVRIQVNGGTGSTGYVTEDAGIILEAYADTEADAYAIAALCRALLEAGPRTEGSPIYFVTESSRPQALPDPRTGMARYTQSTTVRLRGTTA